MSRERTVMMARVKNEGRWIRRCLERTWPVAQTVVLFDDGSTDNTESEALATIESFKGTSEANGVSIREGTNKDGPCELHFMHSPYTGDARKKERVNEIRDKNHLFYYLKTAVDFDHVLCLDGDEMLSLKAVREFHKAITHMEQGHADIITMPFIYLWDTEDQRRVDAIYGNSADHLPTLRFPRLFTIRRCDPQVLFDMRFHWTGTRGGFHCGSIPREGFTKINPKGAVVNLPVIHFGYLDNELRQKKFQFYNEIDPNNEAEGMYKHIIGEPDRHAPGPVKLQPYKDE